VRGYGLRGRARKKRDTVEGQGTGSEEGLRRSQTTNKRKPKVYKTPKGLPSKREMGEIGSPDPRGGEGQKAFVSTEGVRSTLGETGPM